MAFKNPKQFPHIGFPECDGTKQRFKRKGQASRWAKALRRVQGGRERRVYFCTRCQAHHVASENAKARDRRAAR